MSNFKFQGGQAPLSDAHDIETELCLLTFSLLKCSLDFFAAEVHYVTG